MTNENDTDGDADDGKDEDGGMLNTLEQHVSSVLTHFYTMLTHMLTPDTHGNLGVHVQGGFLGAEA